MANKPTGSCGMGMSAPDIIPMVSSNPVKSPFDDLLGLKMPMPSVALPIDGQAAAPNVGAGEEPKKAKKAKKSKKEKKNKV
jgi:hypothetical protein